MQAATDLWLVWRGGSPEPGRMRPSCPGFSRSWQLGSARSCRSCRGRPLTAADRVLTVCVARWQYAAAVRSRLGSLGSFWTATRGDVSFADEALAQYPVERFSTPQLVRTIASLSISLSHSISLPLSLSYLRPPLHAILILRAVAGSGAGVHWLQRTFALTGAGWQQPGALLWGCVRQLAYPTV